MRNISLFIFHSMKSHNFYILLSYESTATLGIHSNVQINSIIVTFVLLTAAQLTLIL